MNNNASGFHEPLIAIALAASALGWAWHQTAVVEPSPVAAEVELLAQPAEGARHGNYCLIPEGGAYFYGKDFDEKSGSYEDFVAWCGEYGGNIGWVE